MKTASIYILTFAFILSSVAYAQGPPDAYALRLSLEATLNGQPAGRCLDALTGDQLELRASSDHEWAKVFLVASPDSGNHQIDWTRACVLAVEKLTNADEMRTSFKIPSDYKNERYVIQAVAVLPDGKTDVSIPLRLCIRPPQMVRLSVMKKGSNMHDQYTFTAGDTIVIEAYSAFKESDLVLLASAPSPHTGGLDISAYIPLMAEDLDQPGRIAVKFTIPKGFVGELVVQAIGFSGAGEVAFSDAEMLRFS